MNAPSTRPPRIAVFGSSTAPADSTAYEDARRLGAALATAGAVVITGGYAGVMEACSRGAREAGGHAIGITVELFSHRGPGNDWLSERIHTTDLFERLRVIVREADGFVAAEGSVGTLQELFLVWTLVSTGARPHAPIVLMGPHWSDWLDTHRGPQFIRPDLFAWVEVAATPEQAARAVLTGAARAGPARSGA